MSVGLGNYCFDMGVCRVRHRRDRIRGVIVLPGLFLLLHAYRCGIGTTLFVLPLPACCLARLLGNKAGYIRRRLFNWREDQRPALLLFSGLNKAREQGKG